MHNNHKNTRNQRNSTHVPAGLMFQPFFLANTINCPKILSTLTPRALPIRVNTRQQKTGHHKRKSSHSSHKASTSFAGPHVGVCMTPLLQCRQTKHVTTNDGFVEVTFFRIDAAAHPIVAKWWCGARDRDGERAERVTPEQERQLKGWSPLCYLVQASLLLMQYGKISSSFYTWTRSTLSNVRSTNYPIWEKISNFSWFTDLRERAVLYRSIFTIFPRI